MKTSRDLATTNKIKIKSPKLANFKKVMKTAFDVNQSALVLIFECLFSQNQSPYFLILLCSCYC